MRNLASFVSLSRVFLSIIFYIQIIVFRIKNPNDVWVLIVCFVLIELSDIFDGFIARKTKSVSDFGKLLDPVCDVTAHFLCIFSLAQIQLAPFVVVAIFIIREIWVQMIRIQLIKSNVVLAAKWGGKIKTWLFGISIFASILIIPNGLLSFYSLYFRNYVYMLYYVATAVSILSGLQYAMIALHIFQSRSNSDTEPDNDPNE